MIVGNGGSKTTSGWTTELVRLTPGCFTAGVTHAPAIHEAGDIIQFTASSTGCSNPLYEFWLQNIYGSWSLMQPWSSSDTWSWDTLGYPVGFMGSAYTIHVWAIQAGDSTFNWEVFGEEVMGLNPLNPCQYANPGGPMTAQAGSIVNFTATAQNNPNLIYCSTPVFAFWLQDLSGNWIFERDFSTDPNWAWNTAGLAPGAYNIHVWAKQRGSTAAYEAIGATTVTLTGCTSATLSPPNPTQAAGTTINFTAGSSGCANPRYAFWVQYPGGAWYFAQGFGGATWSWSTTGLSPGTYTVHVWVNTQGSGYDTVGSSTITLTGCTAGSLSPLNPTQPAGSAINFTASSSGCVNPRYAYWVQYPNGNWYFVRNFGGPAFSWSTAALAPGTYTVHVWVNTQGNGYDTFGSSTVTLT
jgi:hypothetical protein